MMKIRLLFTFCIVLSDMYPMFLEELNTWDPYAKELVSEGEFYHRENMRKLSRNDPVLAICFYLGQVKRCGVKSAEWDKNTFAQPAYKKLLHNSVSLTFDDLQLMTIGYIRLIASDNSTKEVDIFCRKCLKLCLEQGVSFTNNKGKKCWDIDMSGESKEKAKKLLDAQKKVVLFFNNALISLKPSNNLKIGPPLILKK